MTSTELVPVENMTALEELDSAGREVAVTKMLGEARQWLAHAVEATEPARAAEFKAWIATVAESTKQLNLSKEIQQDALEMVRRAERGVGVAVRAGQADGSIAVAADNLRRGSEQGNAAFGKPKPTDFATRQELTGGGRDNGIYDLTDDVTDEQFEEAITEAKDEGNLSRANVVRKIQDVTEAKGTAPLRRSDLAQSARSLSVDLLRMNNRIQKLRADDRLGRNKEQVAALLRNHLTDAIEVCQDLLDAISN